MTSIDPTSKMMQLVRQQLVVTRAAIAPAVVSAAQLKARGQAKKSTDNQVHSGAGFERQLLAQVAAISANDPQLHPKAFRLFMASVLKKELGNSLSHDGELEAVLEQVIQRMQADQDLERAMLQAAVVLLDKAREAFQA